MTKPVIDAGLYADQLARRLRAADQRWTLLEKIGSADPSRHLIVTELAAIDLELNSPDVNRTAVEERLAAALGVTAPVIKYVLKEASVRGVIGVSSYWGQFLASVKR